MGKKVIIIFINLTGQNRGLSGLKNIWPVIMTSDRLSVILSLDDGNGSENVTFKVNSRFFKFFRVYFKLLKMSNVDECPRVGFSGTLLKSRKRKKNL